MSKPKDYILRSKAIKAVTRWQTDPTDEELEWALLQVPSADVVPVVRCRECRYREKEQPGMVYCPNTVGGWVDKDWFCAGGDKE